MNENIITVSRIQQETPLSKLITLDIPKQLKNHYTFKPGQFITITIYDKDGVKHIRCYSICSSTKEKNITIGVKKVDNGIVSSYLVDQLIAGEQLIVGKPAGKFTASTSIFHVNTYVFIAGGSGITPIKSIIEEILATEPFSKITLIYGNYNEENIIFYNFFNSKIGRKLKVIHCLANPAPYWNGETGRLDKIKCREIFSKYNIAYKKAKFYICGPGVMMEEALHALHELSVSENNIFQEVFTSNAGTGITSYDPVKINIIVNNQEHTVIVNPNESILDAALKAKLNINYSCKSGVCSSCAARLLRGNVTMGLTLGLTVKEKQSNVVLTCQARPTTDDVIIDYNYIPSNPKQNRNRRLAFTVGLFLVFVINMYVVYSDNQALLCKGPMNKGHAELNCDNCHTRAPGTTRQQIQANFKSLIGLRDEPVDFGLSKVDNDQCLSCHYRPNDRHPTHRFLEPRFAIAREKLPAENCESCHREHNGLSISLSDFTYCKNCHEDLQVKNDPLDISHEELIKEDKWTTCVQCHDYHGNHLFDTPVRLQDTIQLSRITIYWEGGDDAYSLKKKLIAKKYGLKSKL
ncbi:MAG: 2Fe-2S iron-sulfur cluster-binding protein [Chryseolinea sp.]